MSLQRVKFIGVLVLIGTLITLYYLQDEPISTVTHGDFRLPSTHQSGATAAAMPEINLTENINLSEYSVEDESVQQWLDSRGYLILRNYSEYDEGLITDSRSNYQSYDAQTMLALAQQGDSIAQYYYGLNISFDQPDDAHYWLKEAVINGGYSATVYSIVELYAAQIDELEENMELLEFSDEHTQARWQLLENKHTEYSEKYYAWLLWGKKTNDPILIELGEESELLQFSDAKQNELLAISSQLHVQIAKVREERGFPAFDTQAITTNTDANSRLINQFLDEG